MKISPKVFYKHCYGQYAIAAVNVFNMEQVHGLFKAGQKANAPFVLHRGSAVNKEEIERINQNGGDLKASAIGVSPDEIKTSINYGVCKINIATDLRLLWARVYREFFRDSPDQFDPILPGKNLYGCL